jgi:hypothetical protein
MSSSERATMLSSDATAGGGSNLYRRRTPVLQKTSAPMRLDRAADLRIQLLI